MPEPAKAVKLPRPVGRRRGDVERRFGAKLGQLPGEAEMAVIDLGGEARVGGAELLRGEKQLLGLAAGIADGCHAGEYQAPKWARPAKMHVLSASPALEGLITRHLGHSPTKPRTCAQAARLCLRRRLPRRIVLLPVHFRAASLREQVACGYSLASKLEPCGEKPVHAAPFRGVELKFEGKGPQSPRGLRPGRVPERLVPLDGIEADRRVPRHQGRDLRLALLGFERAG